MRVYNPRMIVRITEIIDTRTWWQRSSLSRMPWRLVWAMTAYGAVVGWMLQKAFQ